LWKREQPSGGGRLFAAFVSYEPWRNPLPVRNSPQLLISAKRLPDSTIFTKI
jgi:hypothetical protein